MGNPSTIFKMYFMVVEGYACQIHRVPLGYLVGLLIFYVFIDLFVHMLVQVCMCLFLCVHASCKNVKANKGGCWASCSITLPDPSETGSY